MKINPGAWNRSALLTCAAMRKAEELAYAQGAASFDLMNRAGEAVAAAVRHRWQPCRTLVLCGPGNNGGDGFIIAESLRAAGWHVGVCAMRMPDELSGDAAQAAKKWQEKTQSLDAASFENVDLVVDALFGTGLQRPLEGITQTVIEKLNRTKIPVIAVDLPSGVHGDTGKVLGIAPRAALTVTFFRKKLGHLLLPGAALCGETIVADIGISDKVLAEIEPKACENNQALWLDQFPFPRPEGHKYDRGHVLVYGGAVMTGAARLAARAAQRLGAGLLTLAAPEKVMAVYSVLESVIVRGAGEIVAWKELLADPKRNAVLIGPGLGIGEQQRQLVLAALETKKPCVLDADALSNFAQAPDELLKQLHSQCVLTPHEGEFARLFGRGEGGDKPTRARKAAEQAGCIVLLKGADTVIADPNGYAVINHNAPPWLATAGAGDVLAGMIVGLLAQGMNPFAAAAAAAWMHGAAANEFGPGLIAEDLVETIPLILRKLQQGLPATHKGL